MGEVNITQVFLDQIFFVVQIGTEDKFNLSHICSFLLCHSLKDVLLAGHWGVPSYNIGVRLRITFVEEPDDVDSSKDILIF